MGEREQIATVEALIGCPFPVDCLEFLAQSDGGSFRTNIVKLDALGDESVLNWFNRVSEDPHYMIVKDYEMLR